MAGPIGLAAPPEPDTSSPVTVPFRNTQLFQLVMQVLSPTAENTTSTPAFAAGNVSEIPYGNESRIAAIVTIGAVFAFVTFTGNLMVMVSFKIDKQLQTISNYFLFSLAVADIAIGMISIPLWTYYTVKQSWGMGYTMCQLWLCIDYLMSNASVLNLLLISFDRYFSVTRPLTYRPRRTKRKALIMIACAYIISAILWPPWIISWPFIEGKYTVRDDECVVQFLQTNPYVTVGTAVAAFYLPVTIMIILYSRVYWETRKRRKQFGKLQASQFPRRSLIHRDPSTNSFVKPNLRSSLRKTAWTNDPKSGRKSRLSWLKLCTAKSHSSSEDSSEAQVVNIDDTSLSSSLYAGKKKNPSPPLTPIPANDETISGETQTENSPRSGSMRARSQTTDRPTCDTYTVLIELKEEGARPSVRLSNCDNDLMRRESSRKSRSDCRVDHAGDVDRQPSVKEAASPAKNGRFTRIGNAISANDRKSEKERKKNERKQEGKAAKTLSAILAAFIVTWTPYNVIVCYEAFFPHTLPEYLFTGSYFLCYINSTINPLCYALCNARFRHTYRRILRCKFGAERPNISRNAYVRRQ
ncbi:unnamed protein product [Cylicocyclus nassatus]|uniref:G-protein coupled receptors family 1 profile domain-containing protein n=1 Tax=Cylicocyclus nassatus TaxID=53992 RepID=A0AA36DSC8_CYLNA|nr:unnamed protein product [Cylicocyclus nassatus]